MHSNLFKITILIPCFNKENFLPKLFNSLLKQVDQKFNIIFLDDNSTDKTLELLNEFKQNNLNKNIKIINLGKQIGIANARNLLINNCESEYFYFLDPDDFIYPKTISYFNEVINKEEKDLVLSNFSLYFRKIKLFNFLQAKWVKIPFNNNQKIQIQYMLKNLSFVWNILINKKFWIKSGLSFLKGYIFEDISITSPLILKSNKIFYTNKKTYAYLLANPKSLMTSFNSFKILSIAKNLEHLYRNLKRSNLLQTFNETKIEERFLKHLLYFDFLFKWKIRKFKKDWKNYKENLKEFYYVMEKYEIENKMMIYSKKSIFNKIFLNKYLKIKKMIQN
ncbi:glycosyltransferase family 2 protein [Mesomycoplasma neurolyticum]|uniref:PGL/p-HBAD biosynthesis glycosyltransferase Rv2957/MT3031 n=1 Tax=Mesomycoplasma neurolyticum TaxID=2120 RepID=A0A449A4L6_9BACT|nr:glycosyltransferase family 2 protein [Mesomycoplasma neurolyticum]VEU59201.1 PGL/p-HBAD biosynthesis glycosyltransferase Rv2957/MT3031 [Mesomycoplasma neurolyticum]